MAYLDTSILGSYYTPETLSAAVNKAVLALPVAVISPLVEVEFMSLLSLKVRAGSLDRPAAEHARREFFKHKTQQLYQMIPLDDVALATAARWLGRFDSPLRTLDGLHLAIAHAGKIPIWTTDKALAASAQKFRVPFKLIS